MRTTIFIIASIFISLQSFAQEIFSEGVINYKIYLDGNTTENGTFTVFVKQNNIKQVLNLNNGFSNIKIFNSKTQSTSSLNFINGAKYALVLTAMEVNEKNKEFAGAVFTKNLDTKKLAGYECTSQKVTYTNGKKATLYSTNALIPSAESFNAMFPGLKEMPLEYEMNNGSSSMKFVAQSIEIKSVDSEEFNIPKDYKIVTKEELQNLK
ncbi:MAG: hypothetical protein KA275_02380 [Chitinophagaceae bacterium]|nr:hypothetical protein [Chitinophagaceae bacterium]